MRYTQAYGWLNRGHDEEPADLGVQYPILQMKPDELDFQIKDWSTD